MKNLRLLSAWAIIALACFACKSNSAQPADSPQEAESAESAANPETAIIDSAKIAAGTAFLEEFYKVYDADYEEGGFNNEYIKSKITPNLKQWLMDSFDYDCDGECMANWLFCYNGGGDTGALKYRTIKHIGDTYIVSCHHDQGGGKEYHYSIELKLVQDGDSFKIDSMEIIEDRYDQ